MKSSLAALLGLLTIAAAGCSGGPDRAEPFGRTIYPASLLFRAESELREPGLRARDLAVRMIRPLEE